MSHVISSLLHFQYLFMEIEQQNDEKKKKKQNTKATILSFNKMLFLFSLCIFDKALPTLNFKSFWTL